MSPAARKESNGKIYFIVQRKRFKPFYVSVFQGYVDCLRPYAGIAGGAINLAHLRAAAQGIHYGMLPASSSDDKYGFAHVGISV